MSELTQNPDLTVTEDDEMDTRRATSVVGTSIVFVAIRCTLQYVVLPFVLPFLGLTGTVSAYISLAIELFALGMIAYNVHRLWNTSWRWRYLVWSLLMVFIIIVFIVSDIRMLMA
jgi:hypothetical protein